MSASSAAVMRLLELRWAGHGRCPEISPHDKELRCVEPPNHKGDHWCLMLVRWPA